MDKYDAERYSYNIGLFLTSIYIMSVWMSERGCSSAQSLERSSELKDRQKERKRRGVTESERRRKTMKKRQIARERRQTDRKTDRQTYIL